MYKLCVFICIFFLFVIYTLHPSMRPISYDVLYVNVFCKSDAICGSDSILVFVSLLFIYFLVFCMCFLFDQFV